MPGVQAAIPGIMVYGSCYETQARNSVRFGLAMFCLLACGSSAVAQSGVSNQRDAYGNLLRNTGRYSVKVINQGPVNNGPIKNSSAQPPTTNVDAAKGAGR
jgi:hypothetical protein